MNGNILVVDDQASIAHFLSRSLGDAGHRVRTAGCGAEALKALAEDVPDVVLLDLKLPDTSGLDVLRRVKSQPEAITVVIMTAFGDVDTAVRAMKDGATDYLTKPLNLEQVRLIVDKALESRSLVQEVEHHRRERHRVLEDGLIRGSSPAMLEVFSVIERVAAADRTSVLIEGESGTGKQVVAGLIHQHSPRAERPFIELNCAAIPSELLESELFGHERGAFTDAKSRKSGLLELADGGTLFLDEIGEMPPTLQVKLLKVLEGMIFRRVGGTQDVRVDVRVISATNRNLLSLCREGVFREDLYYRLKVVPLTVPPLRSRGDDILIFARHFLERFSKQFGRGFRTIGADAEKRLLAHHWPGNIRELRNLFEQIVLLEDAEVLEPHHLRLPESDSVGRGGDGDPLHGLFSILLHDEWPGDGIDFEALVAEVEQRLIRMASDRTHWNQSRTARLLGLGRDKLRYRMKTHGIQRRDEAA